MTELFEPLRRVVSQDDTASSDFDLNPKVELPVNRKLRPAAVLVPIIALDNGLNVILTKRSSALKHHPGQVAFPGGKVDETDVSLEAAALREAKEEIGLNPENVEVLGKLPPHETVTAFQVTPVLGRVLSPFEAVREPGEVDEVFVTPFAHLMDPKNYQVESRIWQGRPRYYYTVPYGPFYIWGATARILRRLADVVAT